MWKLTSRSRTSGCKHRTLLPHGFTRRADVSQHVCLRPCDVRDTIGELCLWSAHLRLPCPSLSKAWFQLQFLSPPRVSTPWATGSRKRRRERQPSRNSGHVHQANRRLTGPSSPAEHSNRCKILRSHRSKTYSHNTGPGRSCWARGRW